MSWARHQDDVRAAQRLRFEVFTLGTLAVIVLIGIAGYIAGAGVRARTVALDATVLATDGLTAAGADGVIA